MSDFFLRLAARSLDSPPSALPRVASRFATPGWDRSPQADIPFAASATPEQSPSAPVAAGSHHDGEAVAATAPKAGLRRHLPAGSSPRDSHVGSQFVAVDGENAARKPGPHARASDEVSSDSSAGLHAIEGRREAEASDPGRSRQLACVSVSATPGAEPFDRLPDAYGPFASASRAGTPPTSTSPVWDEARNASSDMVRLMPPSSDEAAAGLVRASLDVGEHARSRHATPDLSRTAPDTPPAPEIHVSIGRIEVRAVVAPVTAMPRPRPSAVGPALSLEAYLRERQEGSR